jgi:hypothetical protein
MPAGWVGSTAAFRWAGFRSGGRGWCGGRRKFVLAKDVIEGRFVEGRASLGALRCRGADLAGAKERDFGWRGKEVWWDAGLVDCGRSDVQGIGIWIKVKGVTNWIGEMVDEVGFDCNQARSHDEEGCLVRRVGETKTVGEDDV